MAIIPQIRPSVPVEAEVRKPSIRDAKSAAAAYALTAGEMETSRDSDFVESVRRIRLHNGANVVWAKPEIDPAEARQFAPPRAEAPPSRWRNPVDMLGAFSRFMAQQLAAESVDESARQGTTLGRFAGALVRRAVSAYEMVANSPPPKPKQTYELSRISGESLHRRIDIAA